MGIELAFIVYWQEPSGKMALVRAYDDRELAQKDCELFQSLTPENKKWVVAELDFIAIHPHGKDW